MDHFPKYCPSKMNEISNQGPKTSINHIGVVTSPTNSISKTTRAPLIVLIRDQSRKMLKCTLRNQKKHQIRHQRKEYNVKLAQGE